jgi:hypothetical protein
MKNKVDIDKLIEKKYKGNTLDLNDLLDEIDLVLQESYKYDSKLDTRNLGENPESINIHQRMYGAQGARNERPDEPGYGDNVDNLPQVRPTTVAEDVAGKNNQQVTLQIPDIFSLITNKQTALEEDDRVMINGIIANLKGRNWIERLQSLGNYLEQSTGEFTEMQQGDIRQAVSSLITLSLLKRISYSIDQPGKLFEYIIAPIIGPDASVVSSGDAPDDAKSDIVDVNRVDAEKPYSIKFFTGDSSGMEIVGSRNSLAEKIAERNGLPLTYIAARASKQQKTIKFYEFLVSTSVDSFNSEKWGKIKNVEHGTFFKFTKGGRGTQYGIWVNSFKGETFEDAIAKTGDQISTAGDVKVANKFARSGEINIYNVQVPLKQKGNFDSFSKALDDRLNILVGNLKKQNPDKETEITKLIQDFKNKIKDAFIKTRQNNNNLNNDFFFNEMNQNMSVLNSQLRNSLQNLQTIDQQPAGENPVNESQISQTQFSFKIQSLEQEAALFELNLGNPKNIQAFELKMGGNLVKNMKNVFDEFAKLNKNIINFFSTTEESRKKVSAEPTKVSTTSHYGEEAKQNATKIADGINNFMKEESGSS